VTPPKNISLPVKTLIIGLFFLNTFITLWAFCQGFTAFI
jgi:hypothetical protein